MPGKTMNLNDLSVPHQQMLDAMQGQLLIALVRRLAGGVNKDLVVPIADVDNTGGVNLSMRVDNENQAFVFSVNEKK